MHDFLLAVQTFVAASDPVSSGQWSHSVDIVMKTARSPSAHHAASRVDPTQTSWEVSCVIVTMQLHMRADLPSLINVLRSEAMKSLHAAIARVESARCR